MKRVSLLFLALATLLLTSFQTSAREAAEGVPSNSSRYTLAVKWTLSLDGPKRSKGYRLDPATPAVWEGTVFVGNISGILSAIDVASGELRWRLDTGGAIESEALVTASAVYVGNNEGTIAAVSPESGKELWRYEAHDEILTRPFAYGAQLFVFTSRDRLLVLNRECFTDRLISLCFAARANMSLFYYIIINALLPPLQNHTAKLSYSPMGQDGCSYSGHAHSTDTLSNLYYVSL